MVDYLVYVKDYKGPYAVSAAGYYGNAINNFIEFYDENDAPIVSFNQDFVIAIAVNNKAVEEVQEEDNCIGCPDCCGCGDA